MSKERPFDSWLQKQLHAMYDEVASEPLPNDLLNLIDRDAAETEAAIHAGQQDGHPGTVGDSTPVCCKSRPKKA